MDYYNKQKLSDFMDYVQSESAQLDNADFIYRKFCAAVTNYGYFLVNSSIDAASKLFAELTYNGATVAPGDQAEFRHIIKEALLKFNLKEL